MGPRQGTHPIKFPKLGAHTALSSTLYRLVAALPPRSNPPAPGRPWQAPPCSPGFRLQQLAEGSKATVFSEGQARTRPPQRGLLPLQPRTLAAQARTDGHKPSALGPGLDPKVLHRLSILRAEPASSCTNLCGQRPRLTS